MERGSDLSDKKGNCCGFLKLASLWPCTYVCNVYVVNSLRVHGDLRSMCDLIFVEVYVWGVIFILYIYIYSLVVYINDTHIFQETKRVRLDRYFFG